MNNIVNIKITSLEQFYNPFNGDYSRNKIINSDLQSYLKQSFGKYSIEELDYVTIILQINNEIEPDKSQIREDLKEHFKRKTFLLQKRFDYYNKLRRNQLIIGIIIIIACMSLNQFIDLHIGETSFTSTINTIIVVVGWVALWMPVGYFIYDRKDLRNQIDSMTKISELPIEYENIEIEGKDNKNQKIEVNCDN